MPTEIASSSISGLSGEDPRRWPLSFSRAAFSAAQAAPLLTRVGAHAERSS